MGLTRSSDNSTMRVTKPYSTGLKQTSATQSTVYSVLNISGQGKLNHIKSTLTGQSPANIVITATIDGSNYTLSTGTYVGDGYLIWIGDVEFYSSLAISVQHNYSGTADLSVLCNYSLI